ncbi:hypothetical protein CHS0354_030103 [Potamilus streckersoni]|uniref:Cytochrome c oxidase subunit 1 n=1 Tax=Potamilus streckersoni TaxID=2493646 RepID=A0AAE0RL68_9BIVA|nr:hypothetical protein CHS0354_030103 [Potamilus streckersoni]
MSSASVSASQHKAPNYPASGLLSWLVTVDHKRIGVLYLLSALVFMIFGGIESLMIRTQLWSPFNDLYTGMTYNQIFTMHGTTMIFLVVMPLNAAFFNLLIPLQIGARDVAFPRLNAFTYWIFLFGGILLHVSFFFGSMPDVGWFGYANISSKTYLPTVGGDFWGLSLQILGLSTLVASFNFFVTIVNMRAPGMTFMRMPLFTWTALITQVLIILSFPVITVGLAMLMFDRTFGTNFFNPAYGGDVLLWQHIFWVFGHPEVYILILPPFGYVSEILPTFSRKTIFGYAVMVFSTCAIAFLGFTVWAHHMFTVGMGAWANAIFATATMAIAIPTGVKIFNWLFTMWNGSISVRVPWLYAVGFILMFTIGGVTGVMHASVPVDTQHQDSYFVVGHFHYVLIGGALMGIIGAVYYWYPKLFGRMLNEKIGVWQFVLLLIGMNITFMSFHFLGLEGMPRRYYTYTPDQAITFWNRAATVGAYIQAVSFVLFFFNIFITMRKPIGTEADPWNARTLEWSISSPPPEFNFYKIPQVESLDDFWHKKQKIGQSAIETLTGNEHVHLPNPSWKPFSAASALMLLPIGILMYGSHLVVPAVVFMAAGLLMFIWQSIAWALEPAE